MRRFAIALAGLVTLPPIALGAEPSVVPPAEPPAATLLLNERQPLPGLLAGGSTKAPDEYARLAEAGYRLYVDLRTDKEITPEIQAAAEAAGLVYARLPVGGEAELDLASARALHELLHGPQPAPTALVCASGNRSGALLAVEAFWLHGTSGVEALDLGKRAGLTRLEPAVRALLGLPPLPEASPSPAPATPR